MGGGEGGLPSHPTHNGVEVGGGGGEGGLVSSHAMFETREGERSVLLASHARWGRLSCAGIFKQSMGARNRVGIGLSYLPDRLHSLAKLIPWNRFLDSSKVKQIGLCDLNPAKMRVI